MSQEVAYWYSSFIAWDGRNEKAKLSRLAHVVRTFGSHEITAGLV